MDWGIYFDIDGTLISSTADKDEVITTAETFDISIDDEATATYDHFVAQYFQRNFSDGYRKATEKWCTHYGFDIDPAAFTRELKQQKIENTEPVDDIETVLSTLAEDGQLGILTNGSGDIQRAKLERHGIDHFFDPILISGELDTMKPEDEMFQLAMDVLSAEQHVYIADRLAFDVVPAVENGLIGVWIAETACSVADCTISSIADLTFETLRAQL
jgi:HAD superfamily hydrolase (TIGR01549 family)